MCAWRACVYECVCVCVCVEIVVGDSALHTPHRTRHIEHIASLSCALCRPACSPLKHAHSDATERTHATPKQKSIIIITSCRRTRTHAGGRVLVQRCRLWQICEASRLAHASVTRFVGAPPLSTTRRPAMRANTVPARFDPGKSNTTRAIDIEKGCQLLGGCRASDALSIWDPSRRPRKRKWEWSAPASSRPQSGSAGPLLTTAITPSTHRGSRSTAWWPPAQNRP